MLENLILLVGTNPLPNFVVAQYFLKNYPLKNVYFIYSEKTSHQHGTKEYAQNIENVLMEKNKDKKINFIYIGLSDVALPSSIYSDLKRQLSSYLPKISNAHLNYTGGTKAMGIHLYQFLKNSLQSRITFSYLDARRFQIVQDDKDRITDDLRKEICLNINELIKLHGFQKVSDDKDIQIFSNAVSIFRDLINNEKLNDYFNSYQREIFLNKKNSLISKLNEISDKLKTHKPAGEFLSVVLALPRDYQIFDHTVAFIQPKSNKHLEKSVNFLDGGWLEIYLYETLKNYFKEKEIDINLVLRKNDWIGDQKFELDVVLINGYQLIGISCTTSHIRSICKSKGFEIFMRTKQIGGEEAKAVLVTMLNSEDASLLEKELQLDTGSGESLKIIGKEDLKADIICEKINQFIY